MRFQAMTFRYEIIANNYDLARVLAERRGRDLDPQKGGWVGQQPRSLCEPMQTARTQPSNFHRNKAAGSTAQRANLAPTKRRKMPKAAIVGNRLRNLKP